MKTVFTLIGLFFTVSGAAHAEINRNIKCVKRLNEGLATLIIDIAPSAGRHSFTYLLDGEKKFTFAHSKRCGLYIGLPAAIISQKGPYLFIAGKTESNCRINILQKSVLTFMKSGHQEYPLILKSAQYGQIFSESSDFSQLKLKELKSLSGAICKFI